MRSSISYRGLPEYTDFQGTLNYVYGISDFWSTFFADKEVIDRTLEATSYQLSDIYSKFLQLCSTISLSDIRNTFHSQIKLVLIDDSNQVDPLDPTSVVYLLDESILKSRYIMDRAFLPKVVLEEDVHYHFTTDGRRLELSKRISEFGFPVRKIKKSGVVSSVAKSGSIYTIGISGNGFSYEVDTVEDPTFTPPKVGDTTEFEVNQYAIWVTDAEVDEGALWDYFGRFVRVDPATSTQLYQDYLRGIYFLYANGPTVTLLQRGLNLAIGIPFARATEEILDIQVDPETGNYNVITATNSYVLPYGIEPDVAIGETITVGVELAQVASIQDYRTQNEWWINVSIPRTIMKYPDTISTVAAAGTPADYYMRTFLKHHTFLVNIKLVSSFATQSISEVLRIIDTAKPSYTFPIYVWQVPLTQDCLAPEDDDFSITPTMRLGDILLFGEFIKRSKEFTPVQDITTYPGVGMLAVGYIYHNVGSNYISDGTTSIAPGAYATAQNSTTWRASAKNGERACGRWIRSNGDISSYSGDTVDVAHSSVSQFDTTVNFILSDVPEAEVGINDSTLIPLYNVPHLELKMALQSVGFTCPPLLPSRFQIDNIDGTDTAVFQALFVRESTAPVGSISYNCGEIGPFVLEAKRCFIPDQGDMTANESLAIFQVIPGIYSVFLVRAINTLFNPVYFPPRSEDPIKIMIEPMIGPITTHYEDDSF